MKILTWDSALSPYGRVLAEFPYTQLYEHVKRWENIEQSIIVFT